VALTVADRLTSASYTDFTNAVADGSRRDAYLEVWWQMARWQWQEAVREYSKGGAAVRPVQRQPLPVVRGPRLP
jgi:hypothetical protein